MACTGCNGGCNDCGGLECGTGAAGLNGLNAFTTTTATFLQPAFGDPAIDVSVSALGQNTGLWAQVGQWIFIQGAGFFEVVTKTTTLLTVIVPSATIQTYNYTLAAGGATIAIGAGVSPAGIEGATGATGATGTTAISVLDVDSDYVTNTTTSAGYASVKTTAIADGTIGTVDDFLRVEMDVIGDSTATSVSYSVKVEFDGNIMFEATGIINGSGSNAMTIAIDLIVTATDTIIPYVSWQQRQGVRTLQWTFLPDFEYKYYHPAASASITLGSGGPRNIITYLKSDGTNSFSITHYKVTKFLKA
jgi:hypothetical protein